jgi:hypothetical protein
MSRLSWASLRLVTSGCGGRPREAFGVHAVICMRILRDHLMDGEFLFAAHDGPFACGQTQPTDIRHERSHPSEHGHAADVASIVMCLGRCLAPNPPMVCPVVIAYGSPRSAEPKRKLHIAAYSAVVPWVQYILLLPWHDRCRVLRHDLLDSKLVFEAHDVTLPFEGYSIAEHRP